MAPGLGQLHGKRRKLPSSPPARACAPGVAVLRAQQLSRSETVFRVNLPGFPSRFPQERDSLYGWEPSGHHFSSFLFPEASVFLPHKLKLGREGRQSRASAPPCESATASPWSWLGPHVEGSGLC